MTFPGYSRQSGPDPLNAQDLATKHYVDADWGVSAADLNTLTTGGTYIAADTNANPPPFPVGQYFLDVRHVGAVIQQRATHLIQPSYIATRMYNASAWGVWHSPAVGLVGSAQGPPTQYAGNPALVWTANAVFTPVIGRRYRFTLWFQVVNNTASADTFVYWSLGDNVHVMDGGTGQWVTPRIAWIGVSLPAANTWNGSASRLWNPNPANPGLAINVGVTVNASVAGTHTVAANALEVAFEDMGV